MFIIDRLLRMIGTLGILALILALPILVGLVILSLIVTPLTLVYSFATERSYNSVIDSSYTLYRLNKIGQYGYFCIICLFVFKLFISIL